jgi:hypothetical protein
MNKVSNIIVLCVLVFFSGCSSKEVVFYNKPIAIDFPTIHSEGITIRYLSLISSNRVDMVLNIELVSFDEKNKTVFIRDLDNNDLIKVKEGDCIKLGLTLFSINFAEKEIGVSYETTL